MALSYFFVGGGVGIKGTDVWPSLSPHRASAESGEAASRAPQWQGAPRAGTVLRVSQGGLAGVLTSPRRDEGRSRPEATLSTPCSVRAGGFEPQWKDFSGKPRDGGQRGRRRPCPPPRPASRTRRPRGHTGTAQVQARRGRSDRRAATPRPPCGLTFSARLTFHNEQLLTHTVTL